MRILVRSLFSLLLSMLLLQQAGTAQDSGSSSVPERPNIVLIYMDDMGYGDVGAYGSIGYTTPNLNRLAAGGMRFTNFSSVQPVCSASRAAILTGCYPNRIGLYGALGPHSKIGISDQEETIAGLLKTVGYTTACIGKWHLGDAKQFLPLQHGFDYFFGLPYSNDMWPMNYIGQPVKPSDAFYKRKIKKPPLPLIEGNEPIQIIKNMYDQNMLTTWYTEKAVGFINQHKDRPFFLYLAHSMVHVPLGVSDKFRGKSKQGVFGDVMMEIDWSVGQVMKALKENRLTDHTLVIFTADNGPWLIFGDHAGSAAGLKEGKGTTWGGGVREPAIMRWPGVIPEGTVCNQLAANIDILPTLAAISGAPLPAHQIDGVNILSLLKGEQKGSPRDHLLFYYHKNDLEAVRQGHWKLVLPHHYRSVVGEPPGHGGWPGSMHQDSTGLALFDLRRDPGERYDVQKENPEIVKRMLKLVEQARQDLGDNLTNRKGTGRRPPGRITRTQWVQ